MAKKKEVKCQHCETMFVPGSAGTVSVNDVPKEGCSLIKVHGKTRKETISIEMCDACYCSADCLVMDLASKTGAKVSLRR